MRPPRRSSAGGRGDRRRGARRRRGPGATLRRVTIDKFGRRRHPRQQRRDESCMVRSSIRSTVVRQDVGRQPVGAAALDRARRPGGMAKHGGSVINTASTGGFGHEPGIGVYNVSKAALIHLTKQLAIELSPTIRVNAVAPGVVRTKLAEALWKTTRGGRGVHRRSADR